MSRRIFVGGLAVLLGVLLTTYLLARDRRFASTEGANVVLVVIDTLRADHVGAWGYERDTTPVIDAFAADNLAFGWAFATAPWTSPSVASMFTGLYPTAHGVMGHTESDARDPDDVAMSVLSASHLTLAEALRDAGYRTVGITANAWVADYLGFAQGFNAFRTLDYSPAGRINREVVRHLDALQTQAAPWLLYVHYMDPHFPYRPPGGEAAMFDGPVAYRDYPEKELRHVNGYDAEIRYVDRKVGELFEALRSRGLYDDAVIVLVSDHGEQFGEDGVHGHGYQVLNYETHVPLIVKAGGRRGRVEVPVSLTDVYPTVLQLVGVEVAGETQALSLVGGELGSRAGVLAEATRKRNHKAFVGRDRRKLILAFGGSRRDVVGPDREREVVGVFDVEADYYEQSPLNDPTPLDHLREGFYRLYGNAASRRVEARDEALTPETLEQLRALGYIDE